MKLADAKALLTIQDLWRHFGFEGQPAKSCRCPFHEDRQASFSVTADGALFNCFAGCGGGDAVDFFRHATGLPRADACRAFLDLAGGASFPASPRPTRPTPADTEAAKARQRQNWPVLESLLAPGAATPADGLDTLAQLRHVSRDGVKLLATRGMLCFTRWHDWPAWILTDSARVNAQARRMDGQLWPDISAKAQTLPGSRAAWPLGARESLALPVVLLCEGADLLAAHHFIFAHGREADTAAVAMLGASLVIPADALSLFAGKRIRIMTHTDSAGREAAVRWAEQLARISARVDAADFTGLLKVDGSPAKDLNDCTRLVPEHTHELDTLIPTYENARP